MERHERKIETTPTTTVQYEKKIENVPSSSSLISRPLIVHDYRQNIEIRRKKIILLTLLAIQLVFAIFYFLESIIGSATQKYEANYHPVTYHYSNVTTNPLKGVNGHIYVPPATNEPHYYSSSNDIYSGNLIAALVSLIYITVFIIMVAEYVQKGIRIFAWLSLIQLICTLIIIIITIIGLIHGKVAVGVVAVGTGASIIVVIISVITFILTILTAVYAFKLANDMKQLEHYQPV